MFLSVDWYSLLIFIHVIYIHNSIWCTIYLLICFCHITYFDCWQSCGHFGVTCAMISMPAVLIYCKFSHTWGINHDPEATLEGQMDMLINTVNNWEHFDHFMTNKFYEKSDRKYAYQCPFCVLLLACMVQMCVGVLACELQWQTNKALEINSLKSTWYLLHVYPDYLIEVVQSSVDDVSGVMLYDFRADSRFEPSQWETALLCNDVSHWLSAHLVSALWLCCICRWLLACSDIAVLKYWTTQSLLHIYVLVQERRNSRVLAMQLRFSCTKPFDMALL